MYVFDGVYVTDPDNPERGHCCVDVANAIDPNALHASPVPAAPSPHEQAPPSPTAIAQPDEEQAVADLLVATDKPSSSGTSSRSPSHEKEFSEDFGAARFLDAEQQRFAYDSRRHPGMDLIGQITTRAGVACCVGGHGISTSTILTRDLGQVLTFVRAFTEPNDTVRYRCEGCMSRSGKIRNA